jgi:hypothetical protein
MARKKAVKVKAKPANEVAELLDISSWSIGEAYRELQGLMHDLSPESRIAKRDRAQTALALSNTIHGYINCKYEG